MRMVARECSRHNPPGPVVSVTYAATMSVEPETPSREGIARAPAAVLVAAVLVAVEGLALVLMAVAEFLALDGDRRAIALTTGAFFIVYGAALGGAASGLARLKTWSRSPIVLAQLIQLGVAWSFRGGTTWWVAVILAAAAVAVLVGVLAPATTRLLYDDTHGTTDEPVDR